jgi:hypothetical protein
MVSQMVSSKIVIWQLNHHLHCTLTMYVKNFNIQPMQIHKLLISLHLPATKTKTRYKSVLNLFIIKERNTMCFGMEEHFSNRKVAVAGCSTTAVPTY